MGEKKHEHPIDSLSDLSPGRALMEHTRRSKATRKTEAQMDTLKRIREKNLGK